MQATGGLNTIYSIVLQTKQGLKLKMLMNYIQLNIIIHPCFFNIHDTNTIIQIGQPDM